MYNLWSIFVYTVRNQISNTLCKLNTLRYIQNKVWQSNFRQFSFNFEFYGEAKSKLKIRHVKLTSYCFSRCCWCYFGLFDYNISSIFDANHIYIATLNSEQLIQTRIPEIGGLLFSLILFHSFASSFHSTYHQNIYVCTMMHREYVSGQQL